MYALYLTRDAHAGLIVAATCGLDTAVLAFLKQDFSVNCFVWNVTPLIAAPSSQHLSVVELLLKQGAEVQSFEWLALCGCIDSGNPEVPSTLLTHAEYQNILHTASKPHICSKDNFSMLQSKLQYILGGFIPMLLRHSRLNLINYLLRYELEIQGHDFYRKLLGATYRDSDYLECLLECSLDPRPSNLDRIATMALAAQRCQTRSLEHLLRSEVQWKGPYRYLAFLCAYLCDRSIATDFCERSFGFEHECKVEGNASVVQKLCTAIEQFPPLETCVSKGDT